VDAPRCAIGSGSRSWVWCHLVVRTVLPATGTSLHEDSCCAVFWTSTSTGLVLRKVSTRPRRPARWLVRMVGPDIGLTRSGAVTPGARTPRLCPTLTWSTRPAMPNPYRWTPSREGRTTASRHESPRKQPPFPWSQPTRPVRVRSVQTRLPGVPDHLHLTSPAQPATPGNLSKGRGPDRPTAQRSSPRSEPGRKCGRGREFRGGPFAGHPALGRHQGRRRWVLKAWLNRGAFSGLPSLSSASLRGRRQVLASPVRRSGVFARGEVTADRSLAAPEQRNDLANGLALLAPTLGTVTCSLVSDRRRPLFRPRARAAARSLNGSLAEGGVPSARAPPRSSSRVAQRGCGYRLRG